MTLKDTESWWWLIVKRKRHWHVHCVRAVNPFICANDVSDSQMTRTSDGAPAPRPQLWGQCEDRLVAVCNVDPSHAVSRTEAVCMNTAHSAALCPRCTLQPGPLTPSGLRQMLALELLSCHFLLSENRQQKRSLTHTDLSTHPSIHPSKTGWVNAPPFPDYSQASSGMLVRQQVHQSSPTSGLSFRGVHSLFFLKSKPHWNFTVLKQFSCWWFKDILQKNKNS